MMSQITAPGKSHQLMTPLAALIVLVLAGLALRLFRLDYQSLWYDESFAVLLGFATAGSMVQQLISDFVHPPLHYLLLQAVDLCCGLNSFSARALSVLLGVATIPLLYLAGKQLYNPRVGLVAATLFTLSQLGVMYSQEARPYALQIFSITLLLYCFSLALKQQYWAWWCAVLAALAAIYTQYYSLFVIAPLALWAIWHYRIIGLQRLIVGALAAIILYLPWLLSGIIDAALTAEKTTGEQPQYFSISWDTFSDVLNRYNNGSMQNLLSGGPKWLFLTGAFLFTAPALLASFNQYRLNHFLSTAGWLSGGVVVLVMSLAHHTSTAGLLLAGLYFIRAVLVAIGASSLAQHMLFHLCSGRILWSIGLIGFGIACLVFNFYAWVYFMLGLMLGCIVLNPLITLPDNNEAGVTDQKVRDLFLLLACLCGIGFPIVLGLFGMQFDTRYTLSALPIYYLLVAAGLASIRSHAVRAGWMIVVCCYSLIALRANYFSPYKENWRDSMALVIDAWQNADCVTVSPSWATLPNTWFAYRYEQRLPDVRFIPAQEIVEHSDDCQRIWFLQYRRVNYAIEVGKPLQQGLEDVLQAVQSWRYHWVDVMLYQNPAPQSVDGG